MNEILIEIKMIKELREAYQKGFYKYEQYNRTLNPDKEIQMVAAFMLQIVNRLLKEIDAGAKLNINIETYNVFIISMNNLISIAKAFLAYNSIDLLKQIEDNIFKGHSR